MTLPTIHPNGSSGKALADAYEAAWDAIDAAYSVLKKTAPNGRDYCIPTLEAAEKEHRARLARLDDILDELDTLMSHCTKGQS